MADDTDMGGPRDKFSTTRLSAIAAVRSDDPAERTRALEILVATYWKPVYKYIRIKWHKPNEDAKDLTQGFFAKAIEKGFFQGYDPAKARFRTFLRTCVDGFVANEDKAAERIKRGGDVQILSLDFEVAEGELKHAEIPVGDAMDVYFEKEFARSLFSLALDNLRVECTTSGRTVHFRLFERYYLDETSETGKLTYDQLAAEFNLPVTSVTNYLALMRREFRRIVLDKLRELTATDEEFRLEARSLLGVDLK
jgi:DNA-directed RNA polymerase specialized sigma24 family protein